MRFVFVFLLTIFSIDNFAQSPSQNRAPLDTINNIIYGCYPEIFHSNYRGITDSLLLNFPNRTNVDFTDISANERDSLMSLYWLKFRTAFKNSVDFDTLSINRNTKSFFFTLHFDAAGNLKYLFYNWNKYPDNNESFNKAFCQFSSQYNFEGFPRGTSWSQCGTFVYKKSKKKNTDNKTYE